MSNAATIVANDQFRWLRGTEFISSWKSQTGFRSDFCSSCGSPVPNPLRDIPFFWIPAGLLEDGDKLEVVAHLCLASKAPWDTAPLQGTRYKEMPELAEFIRLLGADNPTLHL